MDNKTDKVRKLDMDDLEMVTGGGLGNVFYKRNTADILDSRNEMPNTKNTAQELKSNRPKIIKA